jgi:signal transduction histidine kinase
MPTDEELDLRALRERVLRLEAELQAQRRLTLGALHDLKAPARAIANLSQWIAEDLGESAEGQLADWLVTLEQRAQRMQSLVQDLLSYVLADVREPELVAVGTRDLVQQIWIDINPPADLELVIPGTMPVLVADHLAMRQVFANLLENAVKYHTGAPGVVAVQSTELEREYELAVIDDGPGIAPDALGKVFDPFYRGASSIEGTGMGLALVAQIVRGAGGRIRVESAVGEGAAFYFTWPKRPHPPAAAV